jgi:hypothetical protein
LEVRIFSTVALAGAQKDGGGEATSRPVTPRAVFRRIIGGGKVTYDLEGKG